MAVDLTTGSYDRDGVFSKHNEDSTKVSERFNAEDIFCSLKNFRTVKVLKECFHEKSIVVEGRFVGDDKPAIIVVEKMPFDTRNFARIFNADCRLELKFRNNIYANYHVYPPSGFNGFDIKVIYPATASDFEEFVDEPLQMVTETNQLYTSTVLPHLKSVSHDKWYGDCHPDASQLYEDPEKGFVLLEEKKKSCSCSEKHVRAVCVLKNKDLLSLRDLTASSLPLLKNIKLKCLEELSSKYDLPVSKFLSYVLYPPSHFPLQVHFETVEKDEPIPAERAHHLDTVIFNLESVPDYYQKVTLTYSLSEKDVLFKKICDIPNSK